MASTHLNDLAVSVVRLVESVVWNVGSVFSAVLVVAMRSVLLVRPDM